MSSYQPPCQTFAAGGCHPGQLPLHAAGDPAWAPATNIYGGAIFGRFIVSEVWSSRADQAAFMEARLGAALAAGGVTTAPGIRWVPLVAYHQSGA